MKTTPTVDHWVEGRQDLLQTNPVLWIDMVLDALCWEGAANVNRSIQFLDRLFERSDIAAARIPKWKLEAMKRSGWISKIPADTGTPDCPGVVGLVADNQSSLVVPFLFSKSKAWDVAHKLPFRAETLQDLMAMLAEHTALDHFLPERLSFKIETPLKAFMEGPSMDIAVLIATLVFSAQSECKLFSACCVTCEPNILNADAAETVRSCGFVNEKLTAFQREFQQGTLLVRKDNCLQSAAFDSMFDEVWPIKGLADLFRRLEDAGLLLSMLTKDPLDEAQLKRAISRLEQLIFWGARYRDGLELVSRLAGCEFSKSVSFETRQKVQTYKCDLERHLGDQLGAIKTAARVVNATKKLKAAASYDQSAQAAAVHAASLFDAHRYEEMSNVLQPWLHRCDQDPSSLRPLTRIMVQNTMARALIAVETAKSKLSQNSFHSKLNWRSLLENSLEIHQELCSGDCSRTENYLAFGLLRSGQLDEAAILVGEPEQWEEMHELSCWFRAFLRSELARYRSDVWQIEWMDEVLSPPSGCAHPFAFYFQSTARQAGRHASDRNSRFKIAEQLLHGDVNAARGKSVEGLMSGWVTLLAATCNGSEREIAKSIESMSEKINLCEIEILSCQNREWLDSISVDSSAEEVGEIVDAVLVL